MKTLKLNISTIDKICAKVIKDIDDSDLNKFGITYCDFSILKLFTKEYQIMVRFHMWGSKKFKNEYGHYAGTFDSYYIPISLDDINEESITNTIYDYFKNEKYKNIYNQL